MVTQTKVHLHTLVLVLFVVHLSQPVCVDIPSETNAVLGKPMKLTCIYCLTRDELKSKTWVNWYYKPYEENDIPPEKTHIFKFDIDSPVDLDGPYKGRLRWDGTQDLQDLSISIINVTFNDSGVFECNVIREFVFDSFNPSVSITKEIKLTVKAEALRDSAAIYSEIMMYLLLVFLTCWLLVEMVYCYRKISKSDEQAQDTATNYLAIPSEQKDNPGAPVTK
ncbi:hypothetical protein OYC64_007753 [Pagothenia borchgrevinki]|uniref:Sodium channel regulatory subunit beta-3 n=1 Tax=Pagothenia borchgrevinki TaxID=8213 RepID=A0ABD2GT51_PAGBO